MSSPDHRAALDLSRAQAWVVHSALLARIERETDANNEVDREMELLRTIESDASDLDPKQLELLQEALSTYLVDAPGRDRIPGQSALDEINVVLA